MRCSLKELSFKGNAVNQRDSNLELFRIIAIAASTFGVLLIHANSETMRNWLWKDTLDNVIMLVVIILHGCPYMLLGVL